MPAELTTLGEQAYQAMRRMIVRGELPAGHWLRKRSLANRLQMSATPIVEALRRLEHEGLVQTEPQWGARVRTFTVNEIEELASMRVMLESLVARKSAQRLKAWQIDELRALAKEVDEIDSRQCQADYVPVLESGAQSFSKDHEFHLQLAIKSDLQLVHRELERLQVLKATCQMFMKPTPPTTVCHIQIVEAIATGDGELAELTMRRHIQSSIDGFMPVLRQRFGDGLVQLDQPKQSPRW